MTVINMLSFGDEGVCVADEQASTQLRKYNVAQKLHTLDNRMVYGGSGAADVLNVIYKDSNQKVNQAERKLSVGETAEIINYGVTNYRNEAKNKVLLANMGISLGDLLTGYCSQSNRPLGEDAKKASVNFLQQLDSSLDLAVLLGGIENQKFEIHRINSSGTGMEISRSYDSIGSGADESDKVLSSYVSSLPRKKRDHIDKKQGLVKIIEATIASTSINQGVGGVQSIAYISKDGLLFPTENQCILASEIVKGLIGGYLDKDFVEEKVHELVLKEGDFEKIDQEMKEAPKDWGKFDRYLRGYKNSN